MEHGSTQFPEIQAIRSARLSSKKLQTMASFYGSGLVYTSCHASPVRPCIISSGRCPRLCSGTVICLDLILVELNLYVAFRTRNEIEVCRKNEWEAGGNTQYSRHVRDYARRADRGI